MQMLVSYSETPLVLDAAGALKATHYYGHSALDEVYAYLRAFVCGGDLIFSLTSFERSPPPESLIAAAFDFAPRAGGDYLALVCDPQPQLSAALYRPSGSPTAPDRLLRPVGLPCSPARFAGQDEQGFYWGCELRLGADFLQETFGVRLRPGSLFTGNFYKAARGEAAFGAAFPTPQPAGWPCAAGFGEFVVVPY